MDTRVDFALRSFRRNREIAQVNLRQIRQYIQGIRYDQVPLWVRLIPPLHWWAWHYDARLCIRDSCEARRRIRMYKRVEAGLESGDLSIAIEALTEFCPKAESDKGTIRRVLRDFKSDGFFAASRSPNVLRENMLRLRNELIQIQQTQTA